MTAFEPCANGAQAYTESRFLDKFFSLSGDTDNDAVDKYNLMFMLYEALSQDFFKAIEDAASNSQLSCLVLSLLVAKVLPCLLAGAAPLPPAPSVSPPCRCEVCVTWGKWSCTCNTS